MWKQWVNFVLGVLVAVLAYAGISIGWIITGGVLIALISLWAGLESTESQGMSAHAH